MGSSLSLLFSLNVILKLFSTLTKNVASVHVSLLLFEIIFSSFKSVVLSLRGCPYGGELARLGRLAHLGEMIFIPRLYGIFYISSIKNFVMSLEKDCLISSFYNKQ